MTPAVVLALALGAAPDPCSPLASDAASAPPDPAEAAAYREVGDSERRAGSRDTATSAYRAALARDPADARSRRALEEMCAEEMRDGAYRRGVRLMDAGDRRGAVAEFERARAGGKDPSAALLEGISLFELGEDGRADALLAEAERDPEHRDTARFFRGLVALKAGRGERAASLFEAAAADRGLGPLARDLAREARREGRLVVSVLAESGWDSNVDLAPSGAPSTADGVNGITASGRWAPSGDTGPYLRANGFLRNQVRYDALDMAGGGAAAGFEAGRERRFLAAEAGWDWRRLGGAPYLSAPRVLGMTRLGFDGGASLGATYWARWESYQPTAYEPYSGTRHFGEADLTFRIAPRSTATAAMHVGRDVTHDPSLAWWEWGPRAAVRIALARGFRLGAEAAFSERSYDRLYPGLGKARADSYLDGSAFLDVDLGDRLTLRGSLAGRHAISNVAAYEYDRIAPAVGIVYAAGIR